jgi:hypothetical protein
MEIPFEGTLTKDEHLDAVQIAKKPIPGEGKIVLEPWRALVVIGGILTPISIWQMFLVITQSQGGGIAGLLLLVIGVFIIMLGVRLRATPHQLWEQNASLRERRAGKITDDAVEIITSLGEFRLPWTSLTGYGEYKEIIVLFQGALNMPFPKRFFENEETWDSFRSLVAEKLEISHRVVPIKRSQILLYLIIAIALIALLVQAVGD